MASSPIPTPLPTRPKGNPTVKGDSRNAALNQEQALEKLQEMARRIEDMVDGLGQWQAGGLNHKVNNLRMNLRAEAYTLKKVIEMLKQPKSS